MTWEPEPLAFGGHTFCKRGDSPFLISHATLHEHVKKVSYDFYLDSDLPKKVQFICLNKTSLKMMKDVFTSP